MNSARSRTPNENDNSNGAQIRNNPYRRAASSPNKTAEVVHADRSFISTIKLIIAYLIEDMKRGPLQFKIAVFTIFIIVAFMSILLNANSITVTMFLGIAERQAGDTDFIITSQFTNTGNTVNNETNTLDILNNLPLLNIADVDARVGKIPEISGASERWLLPGRLRNGGDLSIDTGSFLVMGNSLKERSLGIGRALNIEPLVKNECLLVRKTANMIKLETDTVQFGLNVLEFLTESNLQAEGLDELVSIALNAIPD